MSVAIDEVLPTSTHAAVGDSLEPDTALVQAARRRDPEAFKAIVTKYGPRIFRLAETITRNRGDAEKISRDSLTRAFMRVDTFHGESRFSTWLERIAVTQSLMKLRARQRADLPIDRGANAEAGLCKTQQEANV